MKIIGRQSEQAVLLDCLESKRPVFLAVYGRRRVGKTFLVREFFNKSIVFSVTGIANSSMRQQLKEFDDALSRCFKTSKGPSDDWGQAFDRLQSALISLKRKTKKVVFIDELPWLATQRSGFLPALERFWNTFLSTRQDMVLVVCGSATSWIIDNVINNQGGLHNRVTRELWLEPFDLGECETYYREMGLILTKIQVVQLYMVFGGVPFYMDHVQKGLSVEQVIDKMFFAKHAPLANEYQNLYRSLFKNPEKHIAIVEALGKTQGGMTQKEIIEQIKAKPGGIITKALVELEQCGFIRCYRDFNKKKRDRYYQLTDFYTLFYLKHIRGLAEPDERYWQNMSRKGAANAWSGYAFERVCVAHLGQIKQKLGISGVSTERSAWRSRTAKPGVQIDLVIRREDKVINLCEIKFTAKPLRIDEALDAELIYKQETFRDETAVKDALHTTLITSSGLATNSIMGSVQSQVVLEDLFR
jgi:AAA+ ATPase superfamily predicted ATPase